MSAQRHPFLDPDGTLRAQADAIKDDFLKNRWERYEKMVRRLEAHPENREGADKTWVAKLDHAYKELVRKAVRVR